MSTAGFKPWFVIGFALVTCLAFARDKTINITSTDVFMENEFIKVKLNRQRGGVVSSLIYKPDNRELAEEFDSGEFHAGGIAEDRIGGQKYIGGEISNASYQGKMTTRDEGQELTLVYDSGSELNNGLRFSKTYLLYKGRSRLEIKWAIKNNSTKEITLSPWVHNIIERSMKYTVIPKPDGVKYISGGADYFGTPWRGWIGAFDKEQQLFAYFVYDYNSAAQDYYCFWNGYHSMEWVYRPVKLKPGEEWRTEYYFGIIKGIDEIAYVSPKVAAGYSWHDQQLKLQIASTVPLGKVDVTSGVLEKMLKGKWRERVSLFPGKTNTVNICGLKNLPEKFKVDFALEADNSQVRLDDGISLADRNLCLYLAPYKNVNSTRLPAVKIQSQLYKNIESSKHAAVFCGVAGKDLETWQVSTLDKVFKNDEFYKTRNIEIPIAARNERESYQFVIKNKGAQRIVLSCSIDQFTHEKDGFSQFVAAPPAVAAYVKTSTPSDMNPAYPVGDYPDPLLPQDEFVVNPGENQPVWLTVKIPENARSGIYTSTLNIKTKEKKQLSIPLKIEVADFSLPVTPRLKTSYGCWNPERKVLDEVGFKGSSLEFFELLQNKYLDYRFTPRETLIKPCSWAMKDIENKLKYYIKRGITTFMLPKSCPAEIIKKIIGIFQSLEFRGDVYVYVADEAPVNYYPKVKKDCEKFKNISQFLKTFATIYGPKPETLFGVLDIWGRSYSGERWIRERIKAGNEFWTVNEGLKSIEKPLLESRLCYWKHKAYGYTGDLIWNCIAGYGRQNPWQSIYCSGGNGNAHLLYPTANGPVTGIRWENVSDSLEDYDYFCILEDLLKRCRQNNIASVKVQKARMLLNKIHDVNYIAKMKAEDIFAFKRQVAAQIVFLKRLLLPRCNISTEYPLPPLAPLTHYELPENDIKVSGVDALIQALQKNTPQTIILAPGTYDNKSYVPIHVAHKLIAEKPGTAIIKFGFSVGANHPLVDGALFKGLTFNISDTGKCHQGACILTWGKSKNTQIEDCWFYGNKVASAAVMGRQPDGLTIKRVQVREMTDYGILIMKYKTKDIGAPALVEDIDVADVSRKIPRSANGTAEAGLWLGNTCKARRIKIRNCSWMGLWTGNFCLDSLIEDFDIDSTNIGVYMEHDTENTIFQRFRIGLETYTGMNCEWGKKHGQQGASVNNLIQNGIICAKTRGIYMDEGSVGTIVRNVTIENSKWGAVGMYKSPTCEVFMDECEFSLPAGTAEIRYDHWRSK